MANIPYSGFNGAIATYTADTCISNISVTANASWITVLNGNSAINGNVQANTTLSSRTATVTVGYKADTTDCSKTFDVTQDARPCNCGDLTVSPTALTWTNTSTDKKTVTISSATNATCLSNLSVSVAPTGHFNASINGNKIEITPTSANTSTSPITATATLSYKASSSNCSSAISLTHSAMDCECGMLTLSPTSLNWAYSATSADSSSVTISKDSCITNVSVPQGTNFTTSLSNDTITIRPKGKNISPSELRETILVSYSAGASTCTSAITLTQESSGACNCGSVIFTEKTTTIGSGATSNTVIATASFDTCTGSLGAASVNSEASSWLTARTSGNDVLIDADENTRLSNIRSGVVTVTYKANSSDASYNCSSSFTVTQLSVPCSCEHLDVFITPIKTEFGSGGTHDKKILIATGDTYGCGKLSAATQAYFFADEQGNTGGSIMAEYVEGSDEEKVKFYLKVFNWDDPKVISQRSGDVSRANTTIYFIPKDSSVPMCSGNTFEIVQYKHEQVDAPCEDLVISGNTHYTASCESTVSSSIDYHEEALTVLRISSDPEYPDETVRGNIQVTGSSDCDWINGIYRLYGYGDERFGIEFNANLNNIASARTCNFEYTIINNGVECITSSLTLTQYGCSSASCEDCTLYTFDEYPWVLTEDLLDIPRTGYTFNLNQYLHTYRLPPCEEYLTISVDDLPTWASYDSANNSIIVESLDVGERNASITITVQVGESTTCPFNFDMHQEGLNCDCSNYTYKFGSYYGSSWDTIVDNVPITISGSSNTYQIEVLGTNYSQCYNSISANIRTDANGMISSISEHHPYGTYMLDIDVTEWPSTQQGQRTAIIDLSIGRGACITRLILLQNPVVECSCLIENHVYSTTVDTTYSEESIGYIKFMNSGDCLSYRVWNDDTTNMEVRTNEGHTFDDRLNISVVNYMSSSGCTSDTVHIEIYRDLGGGNITTCVTTSYTINLQSGCLTTYEKGVLSTGGTYPTTITDTQRHAIGKISGSNVGSRGNACYSFYVVTQYSEYFDELSIVNEGTDFNPEYIIYAKCKAGQQAPSIVIQVFVERPSGCWGPAEDTEEFYFNIELNT